MSAEENRLAQSGTITFLFTDIQSSTELLRGMGETKYSQLVEDHRQILRGVFLRFGGNEQGTEGDSFFVAFLRSADAVSAAFTGQIEITKADLGLSVRMGLHTGDATRTPIGYVGLAVHQAQRISAAAHGRQVLISGATRHLLKADDLPEGSDFVDLGQHRFKDLAEPVRIYQLAHPDLPAEFPPIRSLDVRANNLPIQLTSLVGRDQELEAVTRLLGSNRLVTLTGAAGCGKTRLALHVAAELLDQNPDGVWLAELADTSDSDVVPRKVAEAVGVRFESADFGEAGQTTSEVAKRLEQYLKSKKLLLVLDNCEHLLASCGELAQVLLRTCPDLRILATSREPLGTGGESAYRVPSLSAPDPKDLPPPHELAVYDSVRLFVDRGTLVDADFGLNDENAEAVAQICDRLDGMPLGIELAAAKVRVLTPHQIAGRLDEMFRLLTGGGGTALERQQTLRAAVDWSFRLLPEAERLLLQKLSVFVGGFDLEAVEKICSGEGIEQADVLDLMTHLVDASFVVRKAERETSRYRLLETIRQYAREKLFESGTGSQTRSRHRDYYLGLAEHADRQQYQGALAPALEFEREESDNLLAALDWSVSADNGEEAARMCIALVVPWYVRGRLVAMYPRCEAALHLSAGQETTVRADLLGYIATLAALLGKPGARSMGEEAVAIARRIGDRASLGRQLCEMVGIGVLLDDPELASTAFAETLPILLETEQHWWTAKAIHNIGEVARLQGDLEEARSKFAGALTLARAQQIQFWVLVSSADLGDIQVGFGDFAGARSSLSEWLAIAEGLRLAGSVIRHQIALGSVVQAEGDQETARAVFTRALTMARESGEPRHVFNAMDGLARAALKRGSYSEAKDYFEERVAIARELLPASSMVMVDALIGLGWAALLEGDLAAAQPPLEEALSTARSTNNKYALAQALCSLGDLHRLQDDLKEARGLLEEGLAIAKGVPIKTLVAAALSGLGELAKLEENHAGALVLLREALQLRRDLGSKSDIAESLQALGGLAAASGQAREACRLMGAAEALWEEAGSVMPPIAVAGYQSDVERARSSLGTAEFATEWEKGRALSAEDAVDYALPQSLVSP